MSHVGTYRFLFVSPRGSSTDIQEHDTEYDSNPVGGIKNRLQDVVPDSADDVFYSPYRCRREMGTNAESSVSVQEYGQRLNFITTAFYHQETRRPFSLHGTRDFLRTVTKCLNRLVDATHCLSTGSAVLSTSTQGYMTLGSVDLFNRRVGQLRKAFEGLSVRAQETPFTPGLKQLEKAFQKGFTGEHLRAKAAFSESITMLRNTLAALEAGVDSVEVPPSCVLSFFPSPTLDGHHRSD